MSIGISCDHAAYELKEFIKLNLADRDLLDFGCDSTESVDYPDYIGEMCMELQKNKFDRGIALCGSGIGASIMANRFKGIRAAICHNMESAKMSRRHNNANVLVMGSRVVLKENVLEIIHSFLEESFEGGRHQRRIDKIDKISE